ncbi:hypothetical protein [Actinospongicola halichondriae]|uniref:hypothetical protein n=1 Tax=Actinospongicola halichondriae TaxID=3236844 RepID=UPI003D55C5E9
MTAAPSVHAGAWTRRLPALVAYVFRACMPRKRLAVLLLPAFVIVMTGVLSQTVSDVAATESFARIADQMIFGLALPLGALVIGDAVLGAEVRNGTLAFSWLTPTRFWELAFARWLGGWMLALVTLVPAAALATVIAGVTDQAGPIAVAAAAGTAAHVALFVFVGCVTRRAAVWSLAIVLLGERLLGAALTGIAQLSPTWEARAVYVALADVPDDLVRSGIPSGWGAVVRLAVIAVVLLAGTTWGLRHLELTGTRD